ncbi:hypothetical protein AB0N05_14155 [Nocardia sp. NPDC051030]|uniref:hypothetical protein n=1 Tax=Nocardia sp. NPDC051030 TaxID=3155162 RepID=UPI00342012B8
MDPNALRRNAQQSQQGAEREQARVSHAGTDPDYIQQLEHFPALSHEEIYTRVQAMDPAAMHATADTWVSIANSLCGAAMGLHTTVQSVLSEGMQGRIASAADSAARQFVQDVLDVADIAHCTGHRISAAAYGAEALRKSVPPPPDSDMVPADGPPAPGPQLTGLLSGTGNSSAKVPSTSTEYVRLTIGSTAPDHSAALAAYREEQFQLALAALEANYIPIYPPAGSGVPAFNPLDSSAETAISPAPFTPPSPHLAPSDPRSPLRGNIPPPDSGTPTDQSNRTQPAAASPDGSNSSPDDSNRAAAQSASGTNPPSSIRQTPSSDTTRSADSDPTANLTAKPASSSPAGIPNSFNNPRSSLSPLTPNHPGGIPTSDPGRSYPAPPSAGIPSTPSPFTTTTRQPSPTTGMVPGMYAPGARTTSTTDPTHKSPAWLIRNRQQQLLGTPPPTVPQTIGAEIPSARTDLTPDPTDDRSLLNPS